MLRVLVGLEEGYQTMNLTRLIIVGGVAAVLVPHFIKSAGSPHCVRYEDSVGILEVPLFRGVEFRPTSGPAKVMIDNLKGDYMPLPLYSEISNDGIVYIDDALCT